MEEAAEREEDEEEEKEKKEEQEDMDDDDEEEVVEDEKIQRPAECVLSTSLPCGAARGSGGAPAGVPCC